MIFGSEPRALELGIVDEPIPWILDNWNMVISKFDLVAAGVAAVQSGVAQVIEDLQGAGGNQETIDKLHDAAIQLGTIATNANTAAQTLRDADPTPPESETPNSVPDPAE